MLLKAQTPAYGGFVIARDEKVVFIRGAIPGEVVDATVEERKRDYLVATVTHVLEPSEHRRIPPCPVFGRCGGCQMQHITYDMQVRMKNEILRETLQRLGGIEIIPSPPFTAQDWHYRHRAQFKISQNGAIGFFRGSSRDVVSFDACPLLADELNRLFIAIKSSVALHGITDLHIAAGTDAVAYIKGESLTERVPERLIEAGLHGVVDDKGVSVGAGFTEFDLNGLRYRVSPLTFFQSHWSLNRKVVEFLVTQLQPLQGKSVLDLYAGAGNFSLPLAEKGADITAVEEHQSAVEDGMANVQLNDLKKCRFNRSSAEKYRIKKQYDVILLDPPRPGITTEVRKNILAMPPRELVYLSCNPATLARDLKHLKEKYDIAGVRMIDFFPNTFHIEALAFLQLR